MCFSERLLCVPQIVTAHICLQLGRCWVCGWGVGDFICLSLTAGVVTYTQHWDEGASHWVGVSMNTVPWCCTAQLAICNLVPWQFYHMFAHSRNNGPPKKCGLENLNICLLLLPFTSQTHTLCVPLWLVLRSLYVFWCSDDITPISEQWPQHSNYWAVMTSHPMDLPQWTAYYLCTSLLEGNVLV